MTQRIQKRAASVRVRRVPVRALAFRVLVPVLVEEDTQMSFFRKKTIPTGRFS